MADDPADLAAAVGRRRLCHFYVGPHRVWWAELPELPQPNSELAIGSILMHVESVEDGLTDPHGLPLAIVRLSCFAKNERK